MEKVGFGDRGDDPGWLLAGMSRNPVGRPNCSYSIQEVESGGLILGLIGAKDAYNGLLTSKG